MPIKKHTHIFLALLSNPLKNMILYSLYSDSTCVTRIKKLKRMADF